MIVCSRRLDGGVDGAARHGTERPTRGSRREHIAMQSTTCIGEDCMNVDTMSVRVCSLPYFVHILQFSPIHSARCGARCERGHRAVNKLM